MGWVPHRLCRKPPSLPTQATPSHAAQKLSGQPGHFPSPHGHLTLTPWSLPGPEALLQVPQMGAGGEWGVQLVKEQWKEKRARRPLQQVRGERERAGCAAACGALVFVSEQQRVEPSSHPEWAGWGDPPHPHGPPGLNLTSVIWATFRGS